MRKSVFLTESVASALPLLPRTRCPALWLTTRPWTRISQIAATSAEAACHPTRTSGSSRTWEEQRSIGTLSTCCVGEGTSRASTKTSGGGLRWCWKDISAVEYSVHVVTLCFRTFSCVPACLICQSRLTPALRLYINFTRTCLIGPFKPLISPQHPNFKLTNCSAASQHVHSLIINPSLVF